MYEKIVFFNNWHNGDIHVSRNILKKIINKVLELYPNTIFYYTHINPPNLLNDIDKLIFSPDKINNIKNPHSNLIDINGELYINTWYGQQNYKYLNKYGTTIDCLYSALDDSCKSVWNFSLSGLSKNFHEFFPSIDYNKFDISHSKIWLNSHKEKKIFVANGPAMSGQAINFPMLPIITNLAKKYKNIIFILSNDEGNITENNIIYSNNIIKKDKLSDLNENSFISTYCDLIIGRSSGAFTFSITQDNLFNRVVKILNFSNLIDANSDKFWCGSLFSKNINYSSEINSTNESNTNNVYRIIENNIH